MGLQSNSSQIAATCDQAKFNFVGHDFHDIPQDIRFTISELARWEGAGARRRNSITPGYEAEVNEGLYAKGGKKKQGGKGTEIQGRLFE